MAIPQYVRTERLVLRPHTASDAPVMADLLNDWAVVEWLAQVPYPYTEQNATDWIQMSSRLWAEGREYQLSIALPDGDTLVGQIGLRLGIGGTSGEIGYWLGRPYWGNGYGSEAAQAMVRFAFETLGLHRVWASCRPENRRSLAVLHKAGLMTEGRARQASSPRGRMVDVTLLGLARRDYLRQRTAGAA